MASAPTVIVIIDDDAALLDLLSGLLTGPGRVVDVVAGDFGLTPELVALSSPNVVLLNPTVGGMNRREVAGFIAGVRERTGARFVLMLPENDTGLAKELNADSAVQIRSLLRDPLALLARPDHAMSMPVAPVVPTVQSTVASLSVDDILSMDLGEDVLKVVPGEITEDLVVPLPAPPKIAAAKLPPVAATARAMPPLTGGAAIDLALLIVDELAKQATDTKADAEFNVVLDTFGEHNLFRAGDAKVPGVFVTSSVHPAVGKEVQLKISFPWNETVQWQGVVAWTRNNFSVGKRLKAGFGVELRGLTDVDRGRLERFLALRAPMVMAA